MAMRSKALRTAQSCLSDCVSVAVVPGPSRTQQHILRSSRISTLDQQGRASVLSPLRVQQRRYYSSENDEKISQKKACAKCSAPLPLSDLSCVSCGALQPLPTSLDAYDLLGIDIARIGANGWQVDLGELKTLWRKRVALSHPDRMGGKDEKEQKIAAQQSALINKAYETLREPLQRAHLLLEKHASSAPSETDSLEDAEVLMEVMELREGLEGAASEEEAAEVRQRNKVHLDQAINTLKDAFSSSPIDVEQARIAAVGLRYWTNIDKAAREWQPGKKVELQH